MPPDLLLAALPLAQIDMAVLSLVGLGLTLIVTIGGWIGQSKLGSHRLAELEKGLAKTEAAHEKVVEGLRGEISELRKDLAKLQRQVDRQPTHPHATLSGTWTQEDSK